MSWPRRDPGAGATTGSAGSPGAQAWEDEMIEKYVGVDNGVTGSLAIVSHDGSVDVFTPMCTVKEQDYTKAKKNVSRVKVEWLELLLSGLEPGKVRIGVERPMVNPTRFQASLSAIRAYEALLIVLERLRLPREMLDSRAWQSALLPHGVSGSDELKAASRQMGLRLHPELAAVIEKHGDADGLLIAEYLRRQSC